MIKIMDFLKQSSETSKKMKKLLFLVTAVYIASFLAGYLMVYIQVTFALEFKELLFESVTTQQPITSIIGALLGGNLAVAIVLTFLVNLSVGAFVTTTLPGVIPLVGGVICVVMTGYRGFIIGLIYYDVFRFSIGHTIVAAGTLFLEWGAYVFSAAAGINISLSTLFPNRYQVDSRWLAFKEAWKDAGRMYVIVVTLLVLGAIWEMVGIYLLIF